MKCKPYSEITVEVVTHSKTVKIRLNIFAVCQVLNAYSEIQILNEECYIVNELSFFAFVSSVWLILHAYMSHYTP